jgi:hypothetical protein
MTRQHVRAETTGLKMSTPIETSALALALLLAASVAAVAP